jgi:hypothetical protein
MQDDKTYGQILAEHRAKNQILEDDIREYTKAMEPAIMNQINEGITQALADPVFQNKDFYIEMRIKFHHLGRVPETIVFVRHSAPTPSYKQTVWKYFHESGSLDYLWHLPDLRLYTQIIHNAHEYSQKKEYQNMVKFVLMDASGDLLTFVKRLNGDKPDAIIKVSADA